jgi:hypothetical protein
MKKITIYTSRPRALYGSIEDVNFLSCFNKPFYQDKIILAEGHDFKYVHSIEMYPKIDKLVSLVDNVMVLHRNGIIDVNQYYEVIVALMQNVPVFGININGRKTQKVIGIKKIYESGIRKRAILELIDIKNENT